MRVFTKSPLPFQGQKRFFLKEYEKVLNGFPREAVVVDLFGGSGILSHFTKQRLPSAKVVYNDYDNFSLRLQNIPGTNQILKELNDIKSGCEEDKRIVGQPREDILNVIKSHENGGGTWIISLYPVVYYSAASMQRRLMS